MSFNYRFIFKRVSILTIFIGISMIVPIITALVYNEWYEAQTFFVISLIMILCSCLILHFLSPILGHIRMRDGYLMVTIGLISASFLGGIPYLVLTPNPSVIDSLFESISAFTTTGATLLNLDIVPKSLLMWKCVCSWLGALGILVLTISILPALGIEGKSLAQAEVPGQILGKITNRASDSARQLYLLYIGLTLTEFLLLALGPMDIYDAIINTMASVSTSNISSMDHAFLQYNSFYVESVINTFSVLASINFTLYFLIIHGNWKAVITNIELRAFLIIICLSSTFVVLNLYYTETYSFFQSLRYGIFQVISMSTTSGFSIIGYDNWPSFSLGILSILIIIGGCSFSTSGSIKIIRCLVLFKLVTRGFFRRIHPRSVVAVKIGGRAVSALRVSYVTAFILFYFLLIVISSILLSLQNLDLLTTISSSLAMISNVGIGLGEVSTGDFSLYCKPLRLVLCFLMIAGRLEIFSVITLFMPSFWNPDKYKNF